MNHIMGGNVIGHLQEDMTILKKNITLEIPISTIFYLRITLKYSGITPWTQPIIEFRDYFVLPMLGAQE